MLSLVIASSTVTGYGRKRDDIKISYEELARKIYLKPVLEILSIGGVVLTVVDNLCAEMDDTGQEIIKAMRVQLESLGINPKIQLTGSTEDNAITYETGVGTTVVGMVDKSEMAKRETVKGDYFYFMTFPSDKAEAAVAKLQGVDCVKDIIPVEDKDVISCVRDIKVPTKMMPLLFVTASEEIGQIINRTTLLIYTNQL